MTTQYLDWLEDIYESALSWRVADGADPMEPVPPEWQRTYAQARTNADLLAALRGLVTSHDGGKQPAVRLWDAARAAIAKAEGK